MFAHLLSGAIINSSINLTSSCFGSHFVTKLVENNLSMFELL